MIAKSMDRISWPRVAGIAFGIGTQLGFAVTVYFLFFYLQDGSANLGRQWLALDIVLSLQFAIVHSLLLLPAARSSIAKFMPGQFHSVLFCATTCICLGMIFLFWRGSTNIIWDATGWTKAAIRLGYYGSWFALLGTLKLTGFGYQTGWTQWLYWYRGQALPRRAFQEVGPFRFMRHPTYASFLGLIWFAPRMTVDHAVLTAIWTTYVFVGSYLKDQRLTFYLGDTYREYASRVPGYPGIFFGPLGKWQLKTRCESIDAGLTNAHGQQAA
jgi:protein-S-isoprenylcysteine O-methyltransferase Ste14